ncbi:Lrp/AsnC family transcriptional regulator [Thalassovita mangrovi]|uniref:Winged helix-turn-helix transcriptional regulator n=1 Tax=Thalassovita mangrovi TaxID=2692236 RepID=A0A6L8LMZ2_9RHOB|nr:Lrp/AsnC family transcriptional regulator [Thalassovita mangrovi]MYM55002.1 winged helix-turn-helix transcriptional regulator [Thalassovita mangrovi]
MLPETDQKILRLLKRDSRISNADLADQVGLSPSSCWRRVRALEESGAIRNYSVVLDDEKIGLGFQAIVHVHLTRHDPEKLQQFISAIGNKEEVRDCYATTGESDYHLFVSCRDLNAYNRFLEEFLFRLPAVASAQSNVVLRSLKHQGVTAARHA